MMFEIASKATIILAGAFAASALLQRRSAAERHMAWTASFAAMLALPAASWLIPSWSAPVAGALFTAASTAGLGGETPTSAGWLFWIWGTGTIVVLARLVFSHLFMRAWVSRLGGGAVIRHREVPSAMTWGILNPSILLPDGETRGFVLRHEEAHVDRFDALWRLVAQVACAVYWFHPLVWIAARRAGIEAERACDDLVLESGAAAPDYAAALVDEARMSPVAAMPFSSLSGLERRVRALLDKTVDRRPLSRRICVAAMVGALALLAPLSSLRAEEEVHKIGGDVAAPKVLHKVEPRYTEAARDAGIEGVAVLYCVVTKEGKASQISVTRSLDSGLDRNAVAALEQWVFEPGRKKSEPVAVSATIQINFRLR